MGKKRERDLNFEVNLLPVISLLSVLNSFLLLTAVWVSLGTLNFAQAFGTETGNDKPVETLLAQIENDGRIFLLVKNEDTGARPEKWTIQPQQNSLAWDELARIIDEIKLQHPDLASATIMPDSKIRYQDVIQIMDTFKQKEIKSLGISTL